MAESHPSCPENLLKKAGNALAEGVVLLCRAECAIGGDDGFCIGQILSSLDELVGALREIQRSVETKRGRLSR